MEWIPFTKLWSGCWIRQLCFIGPLLDWQEAFVPILNAQNSNG